jgi:endonuclease YncB( thermonuclease family)
MAGGQSICGTGATLVSVLVALAGCGDSGALDGLPQGREGRVTAVLSGDVLVLDRRETVKLAGVDAPEAGEPYAEPARQALVKLAAGRRVALFFGGARTDERGRTVAEVEDADNRRWLEGALLDVGAARVRTTPDNRLPAKALLAREAAARQARRGLWTIPMYEVRLPGEVRPWDDGFMLVEGRVHRVGEGRAGLYLDLDENWRDTVSVALERSALPDFRAAGLDPFAFEGRLIRVRGWVSGGRLKVDHPEQIEALAR